MRSLLILLFLAASTSVAASGVVIVHPNNNTTLTKDDVERIFLVKKNSFPDGSKAEPVVSKDNGAKETFYKKVLNKNANQLKAYYSKLLFTGQGQPPKEESPAEVVSRVAADEKLIGIVPKSAVTGDVKVVLEF